MKENRTGLYDIGSVGYFTLDLQGTLLNANLTLADMLSMGSASLLNHHIMDYIFFEDHGNGMLSLSGIRKLKNKGAATWEEFRNVKYIRSFFVPPTIDSDRVAAELKDGVLRLHLPKSEMAKPKRIEIKSA